MAMPISFDHCVIHVSDWERSNAFYRDVLGAELVRRPKGWAYRFGKRAAQFAWARLHAGRGGAAAGAAGKQRPLLRMEWADRRRGRRILSAAAFPFTPARSSASAPRGRAPASISAIPTARCSNSSPTPEDEPWQLRTIRPCCRRNFRCRRTTARRATCRNEAAVAGAAPRPTARRSICRSSRAHGGLCLSAHRRAGAAPAGRLGRHPRRARLHAAVVLVPRPLRRAQAARRRAGVRTVDPGQRLSARGGRTAASAVSGAVGRRT